MPPSVPPRPRNVRGRTLGAGGVLAAAALLLPLVSAAPSATVERPASGTLQTQFEAAAARYDVPGSVLLGVAYLQSRWDTHSGAPSVTGGYGPMHLTDARTALADAPHHSDGTEDARGDSARPVKVAAPGAATAVPATSELPARLRTLDRAARLTGLPAKDLRESPAANIEGAPRCWPPPSVSWASRSAATRATGTGRSRGSPGPTTPRPPRRTRTTCSR